MSVAVGVSYRLKVTCDRWKVTCDKWHVTCDVWNVTHDTWFFLNKKCQKSHLNAINWLKSAEKCNFIVSVLLSAHGQKACFSRMRDFLLLFHWNFLFKLKVGAMPERRQCGSTKVFNRPGVAGPVLHTASPLIDLLGNPFSSRSSKHHKSQTVRAIFIPIMIFTMILHSPGNSGHYLGPVDWQWQPLSSPGA